MVSNGMIDRPDGTASLRDLAQVEDEARSHELKIRKFGSYPFFDYDPGEDVEDAEEEAVRSVHPILRPSPTQLRADVAVIRAAGGVVVRGDGEGREVVVVHRPRYDDWTFPKGKVVAGEEDEDAALREVREETGIDAEILRELPSDDYTHRSGAAKSVRYWLMRETGGTFDPNDEVDQLRWLPPAEAATLLTYERDRAVLGAAVSATDP
jgi:8-oxo-dGTP diphosphatase